LLASSIVKGGGKVIAFLRCRDLKRRASHVKQANAWGVAVLGIFQQKHCCAMILRDIRAIHLVLAPYVLEPLRDPVVVRGDPSGYRIEGALFVEPNWFVTLDSQA
jgi:hypothetical protein